MRIFSLFLILPAALALAQTAGQITGTVQDKSGAVVPTAAVRAVNEGTGLVSSTISDESGRFTILQLPVGDYRIDVTRDGFRPFRSQTFRLDADATRQVQAVLELGQVTESITVGGSVSQVETVGATLKEIIDERRITELPLNGRNALQLVRLLPGAVPGAGNNGLGQNAGISVNGARGTANNYLLDGGDNNDPQLNTAALIPNPDSLEEFSVQTNNFSAEYGRNSGAIINAITKSGTNAFHGSAYEFLRNDVMDARSYFGLEKGKLRRNQFGGSAGGPILRDRTFFFGSYEGLRERSGATFSGLTVPTADMRAGNFSQFARFPNDPATNQPFPGGQIPASRFDPAALSFLDKLAIPLPNASNNRFVFNRPNLIDANQYIGRVDHQLSSAQRLSGRIFTSKSFESNTAGLPVLHAENSFNSWNIQGQHTWTISPTLLGSGQFTANQTKIERGPLPIGPGNGIGFADLGVNVNRGAPETDGLTLVPLYRGAVNGYWNLAQDNLVTIDRRTYQGTYTLSWIRGRHQAKFGGEYRYSFSDRVTGNGIDPQFTFDGRFSNEAFADFLLGRPSAMTQGSLRLNKNANRAPSLFFQDDIKVTKNLTLSAGVRWEPYLPFYATNDELTVFRPGLQSTVFPTAPNGLLYIGDAGVQRGGTDTDWNNIAPRFGFAWRPGGSTKTSVRAGYGVFFDTPRFHMLSHFVNSPPYSFQTTINQPASFSDPYRGIANPFPYTPPATPEERAQYRFSLPVTVGLSIDPDLATSYLQQWNLNVQREIAAGFTATLAYVASKGTKLANRVEANPAVFGPGATTANINARRIYAPTYQSILNYQNNINSSYNAFQATLNKRFSKGYTVMASYTYGRSLDASSLEVDGFTGQNPFNIGADKGLSDFDVRQRFIASFLWDIPGPTTGFSKWILGGWQANGIFNAQTGTPVNIVSGSDRALTGTGTQRANLVGNPYLAEGRSRDEQMAGYFNPAAFAIPALGTFGNFGRNVIVGPGAYNLDFALFKGFRFAERRELQYRWEMFNALNHANLGDPRANIGTVRPGQIDTTSGPRIMQMGLRFVF
jgi:outer membrane receptor protein involved in Fe transport